MPRLFSAVELPDDVADYLAGFKLHLPGTRWIEPGDYHLTVRFFGDISEGIARELCEMLSESESGSTAAIRLERIDVFGDREPRALVAVGSADATLTNLAAKHERAARLLGLKPEKRKFTPHVTLARFRNVEAKLVAKGMRKLGLFEPQNFTVQHFGLFSSRASVGGGPYIREEQFRI
ncbi:MAG: RNA 2',3'-cyclic phosphodiesterase [Methylobacteriaceae bacterium]|nr:RNA 2',3'-cyclic phosphodiesterase [Methylobacteriaceae bacterium]